MWILNTITYMGELRRMTQFKDKSGGGEGESIGVGALRLPGADGRRHPAVPRRRVPVGEDQQQHVELARDLAERFNNAFGKAFVVPEPIIRAEAARVMSLDDPAKKMCKSAGSENSYIAVLDAPDVIRRKIRRAVTDSGTEVRGGPDKPALTNLLDIYSALGRHGRDDRRGALRGQGLRRLQGRPRRGRGRGAGAHPGAHARARGRQELHARRAQDGAERAEAIAERTLAKVRERVGLVPRP